MVSTRSSNATPKGNPPSAEETPKSPRARAGPKESPSKLQALVTGGSGFLGRCLCRMLIETGRYEVTVFDIRPCPVDGVTSITGDLTKRDQVSTACSGKDVVFHVATASPTGANATNSALMYNVNVVGTRWAASFAHVRVLARSPAAAMMPHAGTW